MAFGSDNDIKITLTLEADGVVRELKGVGEQLERVGDGARSAGSPVSGLESAFGSFGAKLVVFNQGLDLVGRTLGVVSNVASVAIDAVKRGSAVSDVAESFSQLSTAAGTTAAVFQDQLITATGETISTFDIQKKAIESLRAGLKPDEFITLTRAARALAEQTGGDTKEAIDELSRAFETGQLRSLQNRLGVIDLQRAEEALATQLGVSREELSAQGQVLAARNALLEASARKIAEVGTISADAGDLVDQFNAALENTSNQAALAISSNESLNRALGELSDLIRRADFSPLINALSTIVSFGGEVTKIFIDIGNAVGDFALKIADEAITNASAKFQSLKKSLSETGTATAGVGKSIADFSSAVDEMIAAQTSASEALKKDTTIKNQNGNATNDARKKLIDLVNRKKDDTKETEASVKAIQEWTKALGVNEEELVSTTFTARQLADSIELLGGATKETTEAFDRLSAISSLVSLDFSGFAKEIEKEAGKIQDAVETAIADGLRAAFEGGNSQDYRSIASSFGGQLGSIFGPIGQVLGEKAAEAIFDTFNSIFNGREGQGKVRDNLDRFFGELLKDNPALVNFEGKLRSIFDLEFLRGTDAFVDGTFDDILQGLSDSAQATFTGLGVAFAQFVEDASEQSGQLAAILANNLGGSLNNLQLLVQSTGKSFEDLRGIVIEAFLDGKLSADEALNSLSSIEQIAQKGIPGALGAVDEAFANLVASGTKGGRAVIDALQDIGSEARELGVKDFGALAAIIQEKTGASAEDIKKLFDALSASGITSIDQLEKATVEQLLPVIAQLGAAKFPFADAANEAQTLIEKVDNLPDRIEKKVIFNVETRTDRNSQALIDKGVIPNFGNAGEGT